MHGIENIKESYFINIFSLKRLVACIHYELALKNKKSVQGRFQQE